jgi:hypothetical protein
MTYFLQDDMHQDSKSLSPTINHLTSPDTVELMGKKSHQAFGQLHVSTQF